MYIYVKATKRGRNCKIHFLIQSINRLLFLSFWGECKKNLLFSIISCPHFPVQQISHAHQTLFLYSIYKLLFFFFFYLSDVNALKIPSFCITSCRHFPVQQISHGHQNPLPHRLYLGFLLEPHLLSYNPHLLAKAPRFHT